MKNKMLLLISGFMLIALSMYGQERKTKGFTEGWNVKSNFLYDITRTVNLGVELPVSNRLSLDLSGNYNGWNWDNNKKWKHWMFQPELRLWNKNVFKRTFFALHAMGGEYNIGNLDFPLALKALRTTRHEGWYIGTGLGAGYRWNLSRKFGVEAEVGLGYIHFSYKIYEAAKYGERIGKAKRNYIGPTKVSASFIYRFGRRKPKNKRPISLPVLPPDTIKLIYRDTITLIHKDTIIVSPKESQVETPAKESYNLHYKSGQSNANIIYSFNPNELSLVIEMLNNSINGEELKIKSIVIYGYASPDGSQDINNRLSKARALGVYNYLLKLYPKLSGKISFVAGGEDWKELAKIIRKDPQVAVRSEVVEAVMLGVNGDADEAKIALKKIDGGKLYRYLVETIYPLLRRVECQIDYTRTDYTQVKEEK